MKQETIHIESPEKIRFYYRIAGTGSRIGAYVMDMLIQWVVIVLIVLAVVGIGNFKKLVLLGQASDFQLLMIAFLYLFFFFLHWGYFTFFEMFRNGQSPGKKMMGIKVIRSDGDHLDASSIILRNLMRVVDGLPASHLLGGLVSIMDKQSRRLGDMVADTVVVHEINFNLEMPRFETQISEAGTAEPGLGLLTKLNEEELYVIRRFLGARGTLPEKRQEELAQKLADNVKKRLKLTGDFPDDIIFLERIYREHAHEDTQ